jgi:hypothetical protein
MTESFAFGILFADKMVSLVTLFDPVSQQMQILVSEASLPRSELADNSKQFICMDLSRYRDLVDVRAECIAA